MPDEALLCSALPGPHARNHFWVQVLSDHQGSISIKELSERTCIRADDVVRTLNHLQLIQVQKGVHVLYAGPAIIARSAAHTLSCLALVCSTDVGEVHRCRQKLVQNHTCC